MKWFSWALTFIDDIPGITLPLVVSYNVGDVILHSGNQCRVGPSATGDYSSVNPRSNIMSYVRTARLTPAGQLTMPDQVMATELLAIGRSKVCNNIALGEREGVLRWLSRIPLSIQLLAGSSQPNEQYANLLRVARGNLTKVICVAQLSQICAIGQLGVISR